MNRPCCGSESDSDGCSSKNECSGSSGPTTSSGSLYPSRWEVESVGLPSCSDIFQKARDARQRPGQPPSPAPADDVEGSKLDCAKLREKYLGKLGDGHRFEKMGFPRPRATTPGVVHVVRGLERLPSISGKTNTFLQSKKEEVEEEEEKDDNPKQVQLRDKVPCSSNGHDKEVIRRRDEPLIPLIPLIQPRLTASRTTCPQPHHYETTTATTSLRRHVTLPEGSPQDSYSHHRRRLNIDLKHHHDNTDAPSTAGLSSCRTPVAGRRHAWQKEEGFSSPTSATTATTGPLSSSQRCRDTLTLHNLDPIPPPPCVEDSLTLSRNNQHSHHSRRSHQTQPTHHTHHTQRSHRSHRSTQNSRRSSMSSEVSRASRYDNITSDQQDHHHSHKSIPSEQSPRPPQGGKVELEVSPGVFLPLHGSADTLAAMEDGSLSPCHCFTCSEQLYCIDYSAYVLCPSCRVVSPIDLQVEIGTGVGLGVLAGEYHSWQYQNRRRKQHLQQEQVRRDIRDHQQQPYY